MKKFFETICDVIKKHKKLSISLACATVAVVLIGLMAFLSMRSYVVDVSKGYSLYLSGFNGYATASVSENDYSDHLIESILIEDGYIENTIEYYQQEATIESLFDTMDFSFSKEDHISNGDEIVATMNYDKTKAKQLGIKFKNTQLKLTASDLKEGKVVDAFSDIKVKFEEIAPDGTATVNNTSSNPFLSEITYTIQPSTGLKNGDTVKVTASFSQTSANEAGIIIPEDTKEYTVSGLNQYIDATTELTDTMKGNINNEMNDSLTAYMASDFNVQMIYAGFAEGSGFVTNIESAGTPKLVSQSLLITKKTENIVKRNYIVNIYEMTISVSNSSKTKYDQKTGYVAVIANNVSFDSSQNIQVENFETPVSSPTLEKTLDLSVNNKKQDYNVITLQ